MGLFEEQLTRKPDHYPWTKDFMKAMWDQFWTPNDHSFQSDLQDFKTGLTDEEKEIIVKTLSAIGQIEVAVKTFWSKVGDNLPHPSIKALGSVMAHVETIHELAYSKLLEVLGMESVFEENMKLPVIQGRVNYLKKHTHKFHSDNKKQYIYSLILFTLFVENVSLFSQFYTVKWFEKSKNKLKDTVHQVQYTMREEDLHAMVGIKLINTLRVEYPELFDTELEEKVLYEAEEAFKAESKIINWMLGDFNEPLLNQDILKEFIKDRINSSLTAIGYKTIFEVDYDILMDTAWFNELLRANTHTDFFADKSINYSKNSRDYDQEELF
jgi:ribonucleoside-diphosphate reductase beta chain